MRPSGPLYIQQTIVYKLAIIYDYFQKIAQVELHVHSYLSALMPRKLSDGKIITYLLFRYSFILNI